MTYTVTIGNAWRYGDDPYSSQRQMRTVEAAAVRVDGHGNALFLDMKEQIVYAMGAGCWVTILRNDPEFAVAS